MKYHTWNSINWILVARKVLNLQSKIFEASKWENMEKIHRYQTTMINMYEAKLLSVQKVTQKRKKKPTLPMDNKKKRNSNDLMKLTEQLKIDGKIKTIKPISISKSGKSEKIPINILTIEDEIKQQLVQLALEPQ
nr:hypothetical protein [Trentepohlia sp. YN1242]